jgi:pyruvate,water dikinase
MRSIEELWKISRSVIEDNLVKTYFEEHSSDEIIEVLDDDKRFSKISKMLKEYLDVYGYHSNRELDLSYPSFREKPSDVIDIIKSKHKHLTKKHEMN